MDSLLFVIRQNSDRLGAGDCDRARVTWMNLGRLLLDEKSMDIFGSTDKSSNNKNRRTSESRETQEKMRGFSTVKRCDR